MVPRIQRIWFHQNSNGLVSYDLTTTVIARIVAIIQSKSPAIVAVVTMVAEVKMSSLSTIDALEIVETIAMIKIPEYTESVLDPGPFEFVADL